MSIHYSSDPAWSVEKLRTVIIGTVFTIGLMMALVSEFCLIKPKQPKPHNISPPPAAQNQ